MERGEMLSKMLVLATNKHHGQYDRGGVPYILHPLKVMHYLRTDDEELQCIALGHDLIEDTDTTYQELKDLGFSDRVIAGIKHMTKVPGETQDEVMIRICSNKDAMLVKLCDLRHNSDIRRLKGITEKDTKRIAKYHKMFMEIKGRLKNPPTVRYSENELKNTWLSIYRDGCGKCEFDESDGILSDHCSDCCSKLVSIANAAGLSYNSLCPVAMTFEEEKDIIKIIEKRAGFKFVNK